MRNPDVVRKVLHPLTGQLQNKTKQKTPCIQQSARKTGTGFHSGLRRARTRGSQGRGRGALDGDRRRLVPQARADRRGSQGPPSRPCRGRTRAPISSGPAARGGVGKGPGAPRRARRDGPRGLVPGRVPWRPGGDRARDGAAGGRRPVLTRDRRVPGADRVCDPWKGVTTEL